MSDEELAILRQVEEAEQAYSWLVAAEGKTARLSPGLREHIERQLAEAQRRAGAMVLRRQHQPEGGT
jgi:hypothetical protein